MSALAAHGPNTKQVGFCTVSALAGGSPEK